jgi:hypothetical protein
VLKQRFAGPRSGYLPAMAKISSWNRIGASIDVLNLLKREPVSFSSVSESGSGQG